MKKVKISIAIKTAGGSQSGKFESGIETARTPATPLQTLMEAAAHLARLAEIYERGGDELVQLAAAAVQKIKDDRSMSA